MVFDRSRVGSGNTGDMGPGDEKGRGPRKWPGNTRVAAWDTLGLIGTEVLQRPACEAEFEAGTLKELCTRSLLPLPCPHRPRAFTRVAGLCLTLSQSSRQCCNFATTEDHKVPVEALRGPDTRCLHLKLVTV